VNKRKNEEQRIGERLGKKENADNREKEDGERE
jgi:hypothetical protein